MSIKFWTEETGNFNAITKYSTFLSTFKIFKKLFIWMVLYPMHKNISLVRQWPAIRSGENEQFLGEKPQPNTGSRKDFPHTVTEACPIQL